MAKATKNEVVNKKTGIITNKKTGKQTGFKSPTYGMRKVRPPSVNPPKSKKTKKKEEKEEKPKKAKKGLTKKNRQLGLGI